MHERSEVDGVLFDLLMAIMNSLDVWTDAAGRRAAGLEWRDAVTARMRASARYLPYEDLVAEVAAEMGLDADKLFERWRRMEPWPDSRALTALTLPYGFVTNCSRRLADLAAARSGLRPRFVLSAEEAGRYKPAPETYLEACRRLGTAPGRTLFVAGSPYDAEGARRAGLRAVLVVRRRDLAVDDEALQVVGSLDEIVAMVG